jgi:hypothetical protein
VIAASLNIWSEGDDPMLDPRLDHAPLDTWLEHVHDWDFDAAIEDAADHPGLFSSLFFRAEEYGLEVEDLAEHAGRAWCYFGDICLERGAWRALFDAAGYRVDDVPAERPAGPLTLWRGSSPALKRNWSWADNQRWAEWYAGGSAVQETSGLVWRAEVEPWRLLAKVTYCEAGFAEYVVDTDGLEIVLDDPLL